MMSFKKMAKYKLFNSYKPPKLHIIDNIWRFIKEYFNGERGRLFLCLHFFHRHYIFRELVRYVFLLRRRTALFYGNECARRYVP